MADWKPATFRSSSPRQSCIERSSSCSLGVAKIMSETVLITGGAGFIGSHLADRLLAEGYRVSVLDNLDPQVHGPDAARPAYLDPEVELQIGDIRNPEAVRQALQGVDVVYHLASAVGVGQSMYDVARYTEVNNVGTAVLLEALIEQPVRRLIVASSMSLYGEGMYQTADGSAWPFAERDVEQLRTGDWEPRDANGQPLTPVPTPETKPPAVSSIYALSKYDQERMCIIVGRAYGIPTVALRFFNAYGTRQALSNPYTGVMAIFASRLLNGNRPVVYEDGNQLRDFVSVYDVTRACVLALNAREAAWTVINVGSGQPCTIRSVAETMARVLGRPDLAPEINGKYRVGDIRHCVADISLARDVLGYSPQVSLEAGISDLAVWLQEQDSRDRVAEASAELASRGLVL